jgi:predicted nucleotidyltransferase
MDTIQSDLERYVEILRREFGDRLVSVVLFGSRARGEARPESDIDLLVVVRGLPEGRSKRHALFYPLKREVSEDFAWRAMPIVSTPEEAGRVKPYYLGMLSGHVRLWDPDGFFAAVLERLQERLQELGSRRYVDADGYEYWDLKPDWKPGDVVTL